MENLKGNKRDYQVQIQDQYTDIMNRNSCNPKQELEVLSKNNKKPHKTWKCLKRSVPTLENLYVTISFQFLEIFCVYGGKAKMARQNELRKPPPLMSLKFKTHFEQPLKKHQNLRSSAAKKTHCLYINLNMVIISFLLKSF